MAQSQKTSDYRIGAAYIRVSTDDQLELSPESQLTEIKAFCERENIILSNEFIFIEEDGRSGRKSKNRDAFQMMISTAKKTPKPFDVILLWEFSRFARNQDESTFYKSILRKKLGIDIISVKEPIPQGMYGRLIEMIIEWQDEFYSVNLSTEVMRSMKLKAARGDYNAKAPYGYSREPGGNPVIVPDEAYVVKRIFSLFSEGYDKNYVLRWVNDHGFTTKQGKKFTPDAIDYILENPFYIGKIRWNRRNGSDGHRVNDVSEWIVADSHHEAIIDAETFEKAQERIRFIKATREKYSHPVSHGKHWLSGMVKCPICGKSLSIKYNHANPSLSGFQCLGYRNGVHKESQFISGRKLTAAVLQSLHQVIDKEADFSYELICTSKPEESIESSIYSNELASLDGKLKRLKDAYLNGIDTLEEYKQNRLLLDQRREHLEGLLAEQQNKLESSKNDYREQFLSTVSNVVAVLESDAPNEVKGEALRQVVEKIIFHKETLSIEIYYRFVV